MLEISHISKKYGSKEALHDVSLTLPQGQIVGLFGENGAGKTTLMKCVLGLVRHEGTVTLDGAAIDRTNIDRLSFATCEHSFFPGLTAAAHRDFYAAHFPRFNDKRFHGLMEFFDLPTDKKLRSFSAGMQNQFEVIMALSQGADYILMDEPFAGNDIFNREDFYKGDGAFEHPSHRGGEGLHLPGRTHPRGRHRGGLLRRGAGGVRQGSDGLYQGDVSLPAGAC